MSATGIPSIWPSREVTLGSTIAVAPASTPGICSCGSAPAQLDDARRAPRARCGPRAAGAARRPRRARRESRPRARRSRDRVEQHRVPLVLAQARDARRTSAPRAGARRAGAKCGGIDAAADDVHLARRPRRAALLDEPPVELRDGDDEPGAAHLLPQHRAVDVQVVGVRGEAVAVPVSARTTHAASAGCVAQCAWTCPTPIASTRRATSAALSITSGVRTRSLRDGAVQRSAAPQARSERPRPPPQPVELRQRELPRERPVVVRRGPAARGSPRGRPPRCRPKSGSTSTSTPRARSSRSSSRMNVSVIAGNHDTRYATRRRAPPMPSPSPPARAAARPPPPPR